MKELHYQALYPSQIIDIVTKQVRCSFHPYLQYLGSAIHSAQKQEAISVCNWEEVIPQQKYTILPMDTLICFHKTETAYRIQNWNQDIPNANVPIFFGDNYQPIPVGNYIQEGNDLIVELQEPIDCSQHFFVMGRHCQLQLESNPWPFRIFGRNSQGEMKSVLFREERGNKLYVIVEGNDVATLLDEQGNTLHFEKKEWTNESLIFNIEDQNIHAQPFQVVEFTSPIGEEYITATNQSRWKLKGKDNSSSKQSEIWIQLLLPNEEDEEGLVDPRAVYCSREISEIQITGQKDKKIKVLGLDSEQYRLRLAELPPKNANIYLPSNIFGLSKQKSTIYNLQERPLPFQKGLLRLCELPSNNRWPRLQQGEIANWYLLNDMTFSGTKQQQEFVQKAIYSKDYTFLEGPPGSGKTHAICELILQGIEKGWRILLCSTTHVAVDNVIERLIGKFEQVEGLRIGLSNRVDQCVREIQFDHRIKKILDTWDQEGSFSDLSIEERRKQAQALLLDSVNLTCGTTIGILSHPYFRDKNINKQIPSGGYFDLLIIDEASKSTVQEFLVPAQYCKKWVIVGDIHQLPPFSNPKDLEASLTSITPFGKNGVQRPNTLSQFHQRALFLLFNLDRARKKECWLLEEPDEVSKIIMAESQTRYESISKERPEIVWICKNKETGAYSLRELETDPFIKLRLLSANWVFCEPNITQYIEAYIPSNALFFSKSSLIHQFRFSYWHEHQGQYNKSFFMNRQRITTVQEFQEVMVQTLQSKTWAEEISWRLSRKYQLSQNNESEKYKDLNQDIIELMPTQKNYEWVHQSIQALQNVGVRSIIETLKSPLVSKLSKRKSALTEGLSHNDWEQRAVLLQYQHRMHPSISSFPREHFYENEALLDANTLQNREQRIGWSFKTNLTSRRIWIDIKGQEIKGINHKEIQEMRNWLVDFQNYAKEHPRKDGEPWVVACLSFYNRQNLGIRDMLRILTNRKKSESRFHFSDVPHLTIICATVDRFQGREADFVLLSMRNTKKPGHIDIPNRINVAITRARFLLAIFGDRSCYNKCNSKDLQDLVQNTSAI